ncbi:hypothetical protein BGZ99_005467 [Dissophora globulifera]|uniref:Pentatricopeptide repeat-containing protein n=1 Tax=Dissophora globulifera TaxID=979702 RepID=A0A9P6UTQ3_9FUNG|nr:hypothetical protein BGZ99_005467 [Dissophora globulifera]
MPQQPHYHKSRHPSNSRSIHSSYSAHRDSIPNKKAAPHPGLDPWSVPSTPRPSSHSSSQAPWKKLDRPNGGSHVRTTTATTSSSSTLNPWHPEFIPDQSSQNPDTNYWRLYQDRLNRNESVSNSDLRRLCDWVRTHEPPLEKIKKLNMLTDELRRRKVPFNLDIYNDVAHSLIKCRRNDDAQRLIDIMAKESMNMATNQRMMALQMAVYFKSGKDHALEAFVNSKGKGLLFHFSQFLAWTKGLQLNHDQITRVKEILYTLQNTHCPPNSRRFTQLLDSLFSMDRPDEAKALLNHTLDIGFPADDFSTACVISGLVKAKQYDDAIKIWTRISQNYTNIKPNLVIYNSLLSALCQEPRHLPEAKEVWARMLSESDLQLDAFSFSSMLNGYFRAHDPVAAMDLWDMMQQKPYSIKPNEVLYNAVMTGLFHSRQPARAKEIYQEMVARKDLTPALDTYHVMIKGLLSVQDQEALQKVLNRMDESGIRPNEMTYNIVADTIFSQRDAASAVKVVELMESRGMPKTAITYSAMIAGFVKSGALQKAQEVYDAMCQAGYEPTIHTYGAMMQGAFKGGNVALAEKMADLAKTKTKEGMSLAAYSIMITGYAKLLMLDQAEKWVLELQSTAITDKDKAWRIYYSLLKVCIESQLWGPAGNILSTMKTSGFRSTVPKLNALVQEVERVLDGGVPRASRSKRLSAMRMGPSAASNARK